MTDQWSDWPFDEGPGPVGEPDAPDFAEPGLPELDAGPTGLGGDPDEAVPDAALGQADPGEPPLSYGGDLADWGHDAGDWEDGAWDDPGSRADPGGPDAGDGGAAGFGPAGDVPVGADPDLVPYGQVGVTEPFPDPLHLVGVLPVDGPPWADPDLLGGGDDAQVDSGGGDDGQPAGAAPVAELYEHAAEQPPAGDPWAALRASADPATSTLARFWGPDA